MTVDASNGRRGGACPLPSARSARRFCTCVALFGLLSSTGVSCAADPVDQPVATPATPDQQAQTAAVNTQPGTAETWTLEILASHPHDPTAYTQGLVFLDDDLWESTGNYGASTLRLTHFRTGEILEQVSLDDELFGEGLAVVDNELWQLTWYAGRLLRWTRLLEPIDELAYSGQGWGLCHDGERLWRSDGSGTLYAHDSETFAELERVQIRDPGGPVRLLNELECVDALIYANVYTRDEILALDPATRTVVARIDASPLRARLEAEAPSRETGPQPEALNGIAYHAQRESFFVTGKYWPRLYEVRFVRSTESKEESKE